VNHAWGSTFACCAYLLQKGRQGCGCCFLCSQLTVPDCSVPPAQVSQIFQHSSVSLFVGFHFPFPVSPSRLRQPGPRTPLVAVPQTSVNEYGQLTSRDSDVRSARQHFSVKAVPDSVRPKVAPYQEFRSCIFAVYGRHYLVPFFRGSRVHATDYIDSQPCIQRQAVWNRVGGLPTRR